MSVSRWWTARVLLQETSQQSHGGVMTQAELSEALGISRAHIARIEARALRKLYLFAKNDKKLLEVVEALGINPDRHRTIKRGRPSKGTRHE
jgi:transcriptional regulator with XRE-family HTH domain